MPPASPPPPPAGLRFCPRTTATLRGRPAPLFQNPGSAPGLDMPRPLFTQSWATGGESQSAPVQGRLEPPTCRSIVQHANHQTTMTAQSQRINNTPRGILNLGGSSAKIAPHRVGQPKGAEDRERDNGLIYMY